MPACNGFQGSVAASHDAAQALFGRFCERTGRAVARADVFSATAARMSAFNAFSSILSPFMEIDGTPGVAFEAGVEEA